MPRRTITVQIGWALLAGVAVLISGLSLLAWQRSHTPSIDPARIRAACDQYAGLDLSGWAAICADAGYTGRRVYLQPTGAPTWWPAVHRVVQPEDLER